MTHDLRVRVGLRASALGHDGMAQTNAVCSCDMEAHDCAYHRGVL